MNKFEINQNLLMYAYKSMNSSMLSCIAKLNSVQIFIHRQDSVD